jgi:hypothetical protein
VVRTRNTLPDFADHVTHRVVAEALVARGVRSDQDHMIDACTESLCHYGWTRENLDNWLNRFTGKVTCTTS